MPRVSTFCPRCGESIETEVPDEARTVGRAALACPSCRFAFEIAPPRRAEADAGSGPAGGWQRATGAAGAPRPETAGAARPDAAPSWAPAAPPSARAEGTGRRTFKPLVAALLLFFAAVVGLWLGTEIVADEDLLVEGVASMTGAGNFTGTVWDADGDPLSGVQVTMAPAGNGSADATRTTTTAENGRYHFAATEPGHYLVTFRHDNHTTVVLETLAYPDEYQPLFGASGPLSSVTMEAGDPDELERVSMVDRLQGVMRWIGVGIVVASLLAAAGGVAAIRRRHFPLAVAGAAAGIFTFGLLVGSVASLVALVLVILSRKEFQRRTKEPGASS